MALRKGDRPGRIVYVFYQRVERAASSRRMPLTPILGAAMAHELGHALLPSGSHSASGLMRAVWTDVDFRNASSGFLTFNRQQGQLIAERLSGEQPLPAKN
jgi:hypothetical protein